MRYPANSAPATVALSRCKALDLYSAAVAGTLVEVR